MQAIYAMTQSKSTDLIKAEKALNKSMEAIESIYYLTLSVFFELRNNEIAYQETAKKKHLIKEEDKNPNRKFINNRVLVFFDQLEPLRDKLEQKKLHNFKNNDDAIIFIMQDIKNAEIYQRYMQSPKNSFKEDISFIISLFEEVIAPNNSFFEIMEDQIMEWTDDIPLVNSFILRQLKLWQKSGEEFELSPLYRDLEDRDFGLELFKKTMLNQKTLTAEFEHKTPNWDFDRIALIDIILLQMAIAELKYFPSIPIKVSINEYLEIAKEYSTNNSATFVNGILDKIIKDDTTQQKFVKVGRGLI